MSSYCSRWFILCFLLFSLNTCLSTTTNFTEISQHFSSFLLSTFANVTRYAEIETEFISKMGDKLQFASLDADNVLDTVQKRISKHLEIKIDALKKLVEMAEKTAKDVDVNQTATEEQLVQIKNNNYNYTDLRTLTNEENETETNFFARISSQSGVHVPLDVFLGDKMVIRDVEWTGNKYLLNQFSENVEFANKSSAPLLRQYIATNAGITRIFPAIPWKSYPPLMTVDLFDPRYRHWFTSAITCPKDVLFLVDFSGSVYGQTMKLMQLTVMTIMASLTPNDYINIVSFNKKANVMLQNCFDGFMPATTRNKILLQNAFSCTDPHFEANFTLGLDVAYSAFKNLTNYTDILQDLNYGSGCHKMIIVLTDSTEDHSDEIIEKMKLKNADGTMNVTARFFGIAMGFGTKDIKLLQDMSCMDKGFYTRIDSFEDIKLQSRMFFPVLSRTLALNLGNITNMKERPVIWTGPYMDAQGAGPVLTLSMPILNTMRNGSDQEFLGAAAIDVKLEELELIMRNAGLGPDAYFMITDGNGNLVYHPRRKYPFPSIYTNYEGPDLQMIRRTACLDASVNKGNDAVVLFTDATEETYAQMGYYETIPFLDLIEMESQNEQMEKFRQLMISQNCTKESTVIAKDNVIMFSNVRMFYAERRDYLLKCRPLIHTFSLALAVSKNGDNSISIKSDSDGSWFPCDATGDSYMKRLCLDYEVLKSLSSKFHPSSENFTCNSSSVNNENLVLSFVRTDFGFKDTYPKCDYYSLSSLQLDTPLYYAAAKSSPNDHVIDINPVTGFVYITKAVTLEDYSVAVVGARIHVNFITDYWRNLTTDFDDCWPKGKDENPPSKLCHIVTRQLHVLHSNSDAWSWNENHLGQLDPKLFEHLANNSLLVSHFTYKDYQAKCSIEVADCPNKVNDANSLALPILRWLRHLFGSFTWFLDKTLWVQLWTFVFHLFLPVNSRLPNCLIDKPKMEQNCIMLRHFYSMNLTQLPVSDEITDGCLIPRKYNLFRVPNTNLFMAIVDKPIECTLTKSPFKPEKIPECGEIKVRYRNRKLKYCTEFHPLENSTHCQNKSNEIKSSVIYVVLIISFMHFLCDKKVFIS